MSSMTLAMLLTLKDLASGPLGEFHGKLQKTSQSMMAIGSTAMEAGGKILGMLQAPIAAFAEAEDAAIRLKVATMGADGQASPHFEKMNKLATSLGNKLPGTTAQFQNMFSALVKAGASTEGILNGLGEATGNLAVVLKMDFQAAAEFAGETSKAMGIAAQDMTGWMDTIQRLDHLGIKAGDMGYAFAKAGTALKGVGVEGLKAASNFAPIIATLIESGQSGETVGTNMTTMLNSLKSFQLGADKSARLAKQSLRAMGIELNIFDKAGMLRGPRELIVELEKLKKLSPEKQLKAISDIFGTGQDAEFAKQLMMGGVEKYDSMVKRMEDQAKLNQRVNEILLSFTNIWEAATGAFETTLGKLAKSVAPELKALAETFGRLSDRLGAFTEAHPKITKMAVVLTALTGVGLLLGGGLVFSLGVMLNMVSTISGVMPMAVTFLSTKFLHLYSTFLKLGAWNTVTGARLTAWAGSLFPRAVTFVSTKFMHLYSTLLKVGQWIVAAPGRLFLWFKSIPTQFAAMMSRIGTGARALGPRLALFFGGIGRTIAAVTRIGINFLRHPLLTLNALRKMSWGGIRAGFQAVMLGIRGVSMAALSNPIGAMIAVLVVAAVLVYKYWQPIKGFFKGVWQGLKAGLQPIGPAFKVAFGPLMPIIRPIIGAVKSVWNWFKNLLKPVDDVGGKAQSMGVKVGTALAKIINEGVKVVAYFTGLAAKFFKWGSEMMSGLANGISSAAGKVLGKVKEVAGQIKSAFTGLLGIKSPSRVFMGYGQMLGTGLQLGMDSSAANILKASQRMSKAATPELNINKTGGLSGAGSSGFGGGGMQITFAPTINLTPGSPAAQQVQEAMPLLYDEFKRMMRQYMHDENRSFA